MTNDDSTIATSGTPQSQPIKLSLELSPRLPVVEAIPEPQMAPQYSSNVFMENLSPYFDIEKSIDDCERRLKSENARYQNLM